MDKETASKIKYRLRDTTQTQQAIADEFGVSRSAVWQIAAGKTHKDVEPKLLPNVIRGRKNLNIEQQNVALLGDVENLRAERNLLKRQLKAATKRVSIVDGIVDQLAPIVQPLKPLKGVGIGKKTKKTVDETLVLMLSDTHADQVVTPEECDGLEEFNFPIAVRRAEVLVESALQYTQQHLNNYRFKKLVIMGLGDYTSGEIHGHVNRSYFRDQFINDLAIAELFANMIGELAPYFQEVEVINIIGNHGRLTEKIEYTKEAVAANHDTLIMKIVELHCRDHGNVNFVFPPGLSHIHDIEGWKFYLHHGHGKKGGSETWTRAKRKSQTIVPLQKGDVHYFCSGHFHTEGVVTASGGATLIGNGAFLACDPYSVQGIDEAGEPTQFIFGVHKNRGVTWRLPINLRSKDEKKGPQRYAISYLESQK